MNANNLAETGLRDFYDPASLHDSEPLDAFVDRVASTRRPVSLPPVGDLLGHEVVLAEAVHALLDDGPGVTLPIPDDRQHAVVAAVTAYADNVARSVLEVADDIAEDAEQLRDLLHGSVRPMPGRAALAGRVLAAVAHAGEFRRSGRDYFMHPDEVASIVTTAWRRQIRGEGERLDVAQFLAYCHDSFEDTIDPFGAYLSERPVIVSPLVAQRVLEMIGVPDARDVARVLLLMTRTKDVDGNRMDYFDYLDRGVRQGGALFMLTKAPDIHHNLNIEPELIERGDRKARARYEKRDVYRAAADKMRFAAESQDAATAWVVHSVFAVSAGDLAPTIKSDTVSLQEIAAAVRRKMAGAV
ncbi:hypothetical protein [Jiangella rhizosphaerae]|uniref:HD domain-containing protein n=1 Tax=Jiangella rhizosphaerae TaxID=2293569 RepID=A0A418KNI0_9ACTN|nr:hypothetical protein [Jiangella rhizosphaerae]RIQ20566.1 hypothetical protein DY240_17425 [Jiangella rhizosphaerae]